MSIDYEKHPPIGIDLGTTNSIIARWTRQRSEQVYKLSLIGNPAYDQKSLTSMVYLEEYDGKQQFLAGYPAYQKRLLDPGKVARNIKDKIGDANYRFKLGDNLYSPILLTKMIVKALFVDPKRQGLRNPAGIVVTVPYHFKQHQNYNTRIAVQEAFEEAFEELELSERPKLLDLLPEPIAAALFFAAKNLNFSINHTLLVSDFGGGTLDLTIIKLNITNSLIQFQVLATDGSSNFGGNEFDRLLYEYICEEEDITFEHLSERDVRRQEKLIYETVIESKEQLSRDKTAYLICGSMPNGIPLDSEIRRETFEAILSGKNSEQRDFGTEFQKKLRRLLTRAKLSEHTITAILPIGGSSQIPYFQDILKLEMPQAKFLKTNEWDIFSAVAKGAAFFAAYLLDKRGNDEHLKIGKQIEIVTRTSHSLGIQTINGKNDVLVKIDSIVPVEVVKQYIPSHYNPDNPEIVLLDMINVYQGENEIAKENTLIGRININKDIYAHGRELDEIPVEIKFLVDDTSVKVSVLISKGNKDRSDYNLTKELVL